MTGIVFDSGISSKAWFDPDLAGGLFDREFQSSGSVNTQIIPGTGSLTITGVTPTLVINFILVPAVGVLALTGFGVSMDLGMRPATGALTITGPPNQVLDLGIRPSVGALTLTGFASSLNLGITPGVGSLTLTGLSSTTAFTIKPGVGALTLTGIGSVLNLGITPGAGSLRLRSHDVVQFDKDSKITNTNDSLLALTGVSGSLIYGARSGIGKNSGRGYFSVRVEDNSGLAYYPAIGVATSAWPTSGKYVGDDANSWGYVSDSASGYIVHNGAIVEETGATVNVGQYLEVLYDNGVVQFRINGGNIGSPIVVSGTVYPAVSLQTFGPSYTCSASYFFGPTWPTYSPPVGYPNGWYETAPALALTTTPGAGALVISGQPAQIGGAANIQPSTGALALTGYAPGVSASIMPGAGVLALSGAASTLNLGMTPGVGALSFTGLAGALGLALTPAVGALTLSGQAGKLDLGIRPGAGALVLAGTASTTAITITPGAGSLVLTGLPAQIGGAVNLIPGAGSLTFAGVAGTIRISIMPTTGALALSGYVPTVQSGGSVNTTITPFTGALVITGYGPPSSALLSTKRIYNAPVRKTEFDARCGNSVFRVKPGKMEWGKVRVISS